MFLNFYNPAIVIADLPVSFHSKQAQNRTYTVDEYISNALINVENNRLWDCTDLTGLVRGIENISEKNQLTGSDFDNWVTIILHTRLRYETRFQQLFNKTKLKAESKNPSLASQYNLGLMYERGSGVPTDFKKAVNWFRLAAENGHAGAQYCLGTLYGSRFVDLPYDNNKSIEWVLRAAENGHAEAQWFLGNTFYYGVDCIQDYDQAFKWYALSANQGYMGAQIQLGIMFDEGLGTTQSYKEAAKWFKLAANNRYSTIISGKYYH